MRKLTYEEKFIFMICFIFSLGMALAIMFYLVPMKSISWFPRTEIYYIKEGDTLWSISDELAGTKYNPNMIRSAIMKLNEGINTFGFIKEKTIIVPKLE